MNKAIGIFSFILVLLTSCSTELDLGADFEETTIVFGLLDPNESRQYIRINRGYFSQDGDAQEIMSNPDSTYFDTTALTVNVEIINDKHLSSGTVKFLPRTLDALGLETGNTTDIIYYADMNINPDYSYNLSIENQQNNSIATATTSIINGDLELNRPRGSSTLSFRMDLATSAEQDIEWVVPEGSEMFDLSIRFYYNEYNRADINNFVVDFASRDIDGYGNLTVADDMSAYQVGETKYIDIEVFSNKQIDEFSSKLDHSFTNQIFFEEIADQITSTDYHKLPLFCEYIFTYSGPDLSEYVRVANAQNGLVQTSITPSHSNIENGVGIFSSRTQSPIRRNFYNFYSEVLEYSIVFKDSIYDAGGGDMDTILYADTAFILEDTLIIDLSSPANDLGVEFYPKAGSFSTTEELTENDLTSHLKFIDPSK